jgi:CRISPR-associated protein Cas2
MFILVSYDIVDDRKRNRVAKTLISYGRRVQKSVFECHIDERLFLKMKAQIEKNIDQTEDSVRYYFLCGKCVDRIHVSGTGSIYTDEDFWFV